MQKDTKGDKKERIQKRFNNNDIMFDLKLVRTIEDVNKYYGDLSDQNIVL